MVPPKPELAAELGGAPAREQRRSAVHMNRKPDWRD